MNIRELLQRHLRYDRAEALRGAVCAVLYFSGAGWLLGRRRRRCAQILMYHSIGGKGTYADNVVPTRVFHQQMQVIASQRRPVALTEIIRAMREGREPNPDWVAVTFDDGYSDFEKNALPILQQYNIPATIFVPTAVLAGETMYFDKVDGWIHATKKPEIIVQLASQTFRFKVSDQADKRDASLRLSLAVRRLAPSDRNAAIEAIRVACQPSTSANRQLYLTAEQIRLLPATIDVGSHSVSHYCLPTLDDSTLENELADSRRTLKELRPSSVDVLAYPFGKPWAFDQRVAARAAQLGYVAALISTPGRIRHDTDAFEIPRIAGPLGMPRFRLALMGVYT